MFSSLYSEEPQRELQRRVIFVPVSSELDDNVLSQVLTVRVMLGVLIAFFIPLSFLMIHFKGVVHPKIDISLVFDASLRATRTFHACEVSPVYAAPG